MRKFVVRFARVVILEMEFEAEDRDDALQLAMDMERKGELGLKDVVPKDGNEVMAIEDYDAVWDVWDIEGGEDEG